MDETFTQLPISLDPTTKAIKPTESAPSKPLADELTALNTLHRALIGLDTSVPPAPLPVNPKRSAQINKLRESGTANYKKGQHVEAVRMYTFGIEMALGRSGWEPAGLVREEVAILYANRAQAHMAMSNWAEGAVDAETSVEMKKVGNVKGWWRRGRCLYEMGRFEEAKDWVGQGLELESKDGDLIGLLKEINNILGKKGQR
ncbi:MAG: hypothetical protein M1814_006208 [Vezdaea aestivalis]|nr:MAG: hypothetical protein M1814_006208 [Vezdaea aestivalis]